MRNLSILSILMLGGLLACSPAENQSNTAQSPADTSSSTEADKVYTVAITSIVEHPALDDVRKGVELQLQESGFELGKNLKIDYQSAQGNTSTAGQIAKKFVGDNPDVIVAIATPSAQSVVAATDSIPVVFSAVTDPVAAKLVPSWEPSGTNVTGISDLLPLDKQIDLIQQIFPDAKAIGYVYSPGEVNSTIVLKELTEILTPLSIELKAVPAQRTVDIPEATKSLAGKVDLIYSSLDNNVVSAYESMYKVAVENNIPLIASDTGSVKRGAIAALGVNYANLGRETGKVVVRILNGENPGDIKTTVLDTLDLYISVKHAEEQGVILPPELILKATSNVED